LATVLSGAAFAGILDSVAGAVLGLSTRKLRAAYSGNCFTLRRSSDNAEADFGFLANGDLDTAAITAWLAGANAFVKVWFDQSGNAYNFSQATSANQPQLILSNINSKPGPRFNGTSQHLKTATLVSSALAGTAFAVVRMTSALKDNESVLSSYDEASATRFVNLKALTATVAPVIQYAQNNNGTVDDLRGDTSLSAATPYVMTWQSSGTLISMRVNATGQTIAVQTGGNNGDWYGDTSARDNFIVGARQSSAGVGLYMKGDIPEVLLWDTALSAGNVTTIEESEADYFGVFLASLFDWDYDSGSASTVFTYTS